MKSIWITWEVQRRNRELSKAFCAELVEISELQRLPKWMKYLFGFFETLKVLRSKKPDIVFCQNPSIVLSFLVVVVGLFTRIRVVVDAHYDGVVKKNTILNYILKFIHRYADYTIVTNKNHACIIKNHGGRPLVLQDPLPMFADKFYSIAPIPNNVLVISSFAPDEPISEIIEAARLLESKGVTFRFTGKYEGKIKNYPTLPSNVILLGYVPEGDFIINIFRASVVVDLTNNEDCLVCGAYEAIAAGRPLVLSYTEALKEYFGIAAVYCDNIPNEIASAVWSALESASSFTECVLSTRSLLIINWWRSFRQAKLQIGII